MKKIVIVTHNMWAGGCERVIAQLANWFVNNGVECIILTEFTCTCFYELDSKVQLKYLSKNEECLTSALIPTYLNLRKIVKVEKPDIVLAMPEKVNVWTILSLIGTGIPVVVSERNSPWIHPINKVKRFLRKILYPFAKGYIFQTKQAASFFSNKIQNKGIVLPNPLDLKRIPEKWVGERNKQIVGVGRLDEQKNFSLLIKAFAKFYETHPDYQLIIYGDGYLRDELIKLASNCLPNEAFSFPGKDNNVLEKMKSSSMFVLSSDYEGMPNVLIEAMAMGMPVISTDCSVGGPAELIKDGVNGLLVPVGNEMAMYEAITFIADNKEIASQLGGSALEIRKFLDAEIVAKKWRHYLEQCCEN